jgi:redox-sensing transcriptional repressor
VNPELKGMQIRGVDVRMVYEMADFVRENQIEIAALTIPKANAVEVANILVEAGIKAIWNFAHVDLNVPKEITVENVHLSESLMRLSYNIAEKDRGREAKNKRNKK